MKKLLTRWAFAILRRQNASLWWDTADVPGLFDPELKGRMTFNFAKMRFFWMGCPDTVGATAARSGALDWNFAHVCPGDPLCPPE